MYVCMYVCIYVCMYVIMSVTHEYIHQHMHNAHAHALSEKEERHLSARLLCIERTPQRASHFLPVWLDQH